MIRIEHLSKRYGSHYALDDVSFEIGEGEVVGLLGPNGAGKSTTMNILTGYLSATDGNVFVNGANVLDDPLTAKESIGYLPEQPPLYLEMTVEEYLGFVYELKKCTLPRAPHLAEIMDVVKITDVKERIIGHLSKGYRQRVGMAGALVGDPPVLIFDEPTVGLDPKQIIEIRNLLRTLGKKHTVILSSHILPEVQAVCERIIFINRGHIVANERTEDIARVVETNQRYRVKICGPSQREIYEALKANGGIRKIDYLPGRDAESYAFTVECKPSVDARRAIFDICAAKGWPLIGLESIGNDLEDIFVRLMERSDSAAAPSKRKKK